MQSSLARPLALPNTASACAACGSTAPPVRPLAPRLTFFGGLLALSLFLVLSPALGFALFFLSPVVVITGLGIGPLAREAFARPTCRDCGRYHHEA